MEALNENWFFVAVLLFCIGVHFLGHGHGHGHGHGQRDGSTGGSDRGSGRHLDPK